MSSSGGIGFPRVRAPLATCFATCFASSMSVAWPSLMSFARYFGSSLLSFADLLALRAFFRVVVGFSS